MDVTSRAVTEEDRMAEAELNLIKPLVERRQASTALRLLADLQARVDNGSLSPAIRFRFFLNAAIRTRVA
jgi:hypothetical protein